MHFLRHCTKSKKQKVAVMKKQAKVNTAGSSSCYDILLIYPGSPDAVLTSYNRGSKPLLGCITVQAQGCEHPLQCVMTPLGVLQREMLLTRKERCLGPAVWNGGTYLSRPLVQYYSLYRPRSVPSIVINSVYIGHF